MRKVQSCWRFGIPWSEDEFFEVAEKARHPFKGESAESFRIRDGVVGEKGHEP